LENHQPLKRDKSKKYKKNKNMTETKEIKTAEKALLKEATEKAEASFQKNIRDSFKKGQGMR
jgi:hypothetical protein